MELFATDLERLAFLLEADAALTLGPDTLGSEAAEQSAPEELPPEKRTKYITNYIGSKQKLVDWIWKHTPEGTGTVLDAFSGSAVVAYMYKTKGLQVIANDRLRDHALGLLENLHQRLARLERASGLPPDEAKAFVALLTRMRAEVVSPVLGYDDLPQLQEVVLAIRRAGARSTASAASTSISTPRPSTAGTWVTSPRSSTSRSR